MMTQKTFTFSYSKVIAKCFTQDLSFKTIQIVSYIVKPIKLNEITDSNKANKPFKEKFGFRL